MTNQSEDVQSFERRSGTYENSFFQGLFFDRIHRNALQAVPAGFQPTSILGIGCGTGRLLRKAAARWPNARMTGVDPAEGMLKEARRLRPGAEFRVSLAESLALPDAYADWLSAPLRSINGRTSSKACGRSHACCARAVYSCWWIYLCQWGSGKSIRTAGR